MLDNGNGGGGGGSWAGERHPAGGARLAHRERRPGASPPARRAVLFLSQLLVQQFDRAGDGLVTVHEFGAALAEIGVYMLPSRPCVQRAYERRGLLSARTRAP